MLLAPIEAAGGGQGAVQIEDRTVQASAQAGEEVHGLVLHDLGGLDFKGLTAGNGRRAFHHPVPVHTTGS